MFVFDKFDFFIFFKGRNVFFGLNFNRFIFFGDLSVGGIVNIFGFFVVIWIWGVDVLMFIIKVLFCLSDEFVLEDKWLDDVFLKIGVVVVDWWN